MKQWRIHPVLAALLVSLSAIAVAGGVCGLLLWTHWDSTEARLSRLRAKIANARWLSHDITQDIYVLRRRWRRMPADGELRKQFTDILFEAGEQISPGDHFILGPGNNTPVNADLDRLVTVGKMVKSRKLPL